MGLSDYKRDMEVIKRAVDKEIESDWFLGSSMINFLVRFDKIGDAQRFFDRMP